MTSNIPFLMKDVVLLAVSIYLLKQDVVRLWGPLAEAASFPIELTWAGSSAAPPSLTIFNPRRALLRKESPKPSP